MTALSKGKSPFYPNQPVPREFFTGRASLIKRILERGAAQVAAGKPAAFFIQGEYGIGKSSIAGFTQAVAEREHGLYGLYVTLGATESIEDLGAAILQTTINSGAFDPRRREKIGSWLAKYIGDQTLFGFTLHMDALKQDAPTISTGLLPFLAQLLERLVDTGIGGVHLVLDEINGIVEKPEFAHYIKALIDQNALALHPVPLLLTLCGTEERRRQMILNHPPTERIFDVLDVQPLTADEMIEFFSRTFESVGIRIESDALNFMVEYSAGYPKIMHLIGDAAFWHDSDGVLNLEDATIAVLNAAEDVGRRFFDQQVFKALRSKDYHSILRKIAQTGFDLTFRKEDIRRLLSTSETKKFANFLQKMRKLGVLQPGVDRGEYTFTSRMARLYIWLDSIRRLR